MSLTPDVTLAWIAEGNFMQWLAFSVVLVSLGMSFRHVSRARSSDLPKRVVSGLSLYVVIVAVSLGVAAVMTFLTRVRQLRAANAYEASSQVSLVIFGFLLLGAECAVTAAMWLT